MGLAHVFNRVERYARLLSDTHVLQHPNEMANAMYLRRHVLNVRATHAASSSPSQTTPPPPRLPATNDLGTILETQVRRQCPRYPYIQHRAYRHPSRFRMFPAHVPFIGKRGDESNVIPTGSVLTVGRSQIFPWSGMVAKITAIRRHPQAVIYAKGFLIQ